MQNLQASWRNPKTDNPIVLVKRQAYPFLSLLLYDIDTPYPYHRKSSPYLHLLKTNIACTAAAGVTLCKLGYIHRNQTVPYEPPNPRNHILHCYVIEVVGHHLPINPAIEREVMAKRGRESYDLAAFCERNQVTSVAKGCFIYNGKNNAVETRDK